jgi:hypothetical protein
MTTELPSDYSDEDSGPAAEEPTLPPNNNINRACTTPVSEAPLAPKTPPPTEAQYRQGIEMKQKDPSLSIAEICGRLGLSNRYVRTYNASKVQET